MWNPGHKQHSTSMHMHTCPHMYIILVQSWGQSQDMDDFTSLKCYCIIKYKQTKPEPWKTKVRAQFSRSVLVFLVGALPCVWSITVCVRNSQRCSIISWEPGWSPEPLRTVIMSAPAVQNRCSSPALAAWKSLWQVAILGKLVKTTVALQVDAAMLGCGAKQQSGKQSQPGQHSPAGVCHLAPLQQTGGC